MGTGEKRGILPQEKPACPLPMQGAVETIDVEIPG
jgi:hypothetical protein